MKRKAYLYHFVSGKWVQHSEAGDMTGMQILMMNLVLKDGWMISAVAIGDLAA